MIAVSGATGLIGSAVIRALGAQPHRALTGDIRDGDALESQLRGCSAVVHAAFKSVDADNSGFAVNPDGTRALVAAAQAAGVRRVVLTSTVGVYGHAPHRDADESTPVAPDTPFSASRAEAERVLLDADLEGIVLRHRFVYGPGDRAVLPRIWRSATKLPVWVSGGRAQLSLVHVDDFATVLVRAAEAPLPPEPVLHVTDGAPRSLREVAEALCARLGGRPPRWSLPYGLLVGPLSLWERARGIDPEASERAVTSLRLKLAAQDQSFSNERLVRWLPMRFRSLEEGLDTSLAWYRELEPRS